MDVKCLAHEGLGAFIGREGLGRSVNRGIQHKTSSSLFQ